MSVDPLLSAIEDHLDSYKSAEIRDAPRTASEDGRPNQIRLPGQRPLPQGQRCDASTQDRRRRRFRRSRPGGNRLRRDDETGDVVISQEKTNLGTKNLPNRTYRFQSVTIDTEEGPSDTAKIEFTGESNRSVAEIPAT